MKKKILAIIMVMALCLVLCACGGGTAATITDNDGNTVQMTAKELKEVYDENEARFDKLYKDAEITLTGTVESIKSNFMYSGSSTRYDSITLEDGWQVDIAHGSHDDVLSELGAGSTITVTSEIYSAVGANIKLCSMSSSNGRIWDDYSEIALN